MKQVILQVVLLATAFSGVCQSGEQILSKHFDAMGQEVWDQVNDVTIDGRWVDQSFVDSEIKLLYKEPEQIRIEGNYKNQSFREACVADDCWIQASWRESESELMTREEKLILRNSFVKGSPLFQYQDQLQFLGLIDMEGRLYMGFQYESEKMQKTFYLDRDDYKIYFEEITWKDPEINILKVYEKYRSFSGLNVPASIRFEGENLDQEIVYDQLYFGLGINDAVFKNPFGQ